MNHLLNTVTHGDCFELFPQLPDHSIDMALFDPPFGTTSCRWDDALAKMKRGERTALQELFAQVLRVVKEDGAILVCAQQPFATDCINAARRYFRYEWIWHKRVATGFLNSNRMPMRAHENVLVFYRKLPFWAHNVPYDGAPTVKATHDYVYNSLHGSRRDKVKLDKPRSVVEYGHDRKQGFRHPTKKPQSMFEFFIQCYTKPGEIVLDPFVGSGTTGAAALATGRQFVAFERDTEYAVMAQNRISQ